MRGWRWWLAAVVAAIAVVVSSCGIPSDGKPRDIAEDEQVWTIILSANGRGFCSGIDLAGEGWSGVKQWKDQGERLHDPGAFLSPKSQRVFKPVEGKRLSDLIVSTAVLEGGPTLSKGGLIASLLMRLAESGHISATPRSRQRSGADRYRHP